MAGFSETIHVAEAIGALLLGLVFSETEHRDRIEHLVVPFREFLWSYLFFSFGLSIDPLTLWDAGWLALGAVALTIIGNFTAGMISGRKSGLYTRPLPTWVNDYVTRSEFSIIMANIGIEGGLSAILQPFAALYVLILAIIGLC